jgi:hypothetical protein
MAWLREYKPDGSKQTRICRYQTMEQTDTNIINKYYNAQVV